MKIIVLTSNAYHHALPGFCYCFNKYWPGQSPTIVHYEAPLPDLPPNFKSTDIGRQADYTFSTGLAAYLETVPDHQVTLLLEDYWLSEFVDAGKWYALQRVMYDDPTVEKIDLSDDRFKYPHDVLPDALMGRYPMVESKPDAPYQMSLQAAVWRRTFLLRFLAEPDTAWGVEKRGTRRLIAAREDGSYSGRILGFVDPLLHYVNAIGGEGNMPDVYAKKRFPRAMWDELKSLGYVKEPPRVKSKT